MSELAEQLKNQLDQLPKDDRAELACYLLTTLEEEENDEVDPDFTATLQRRIAEIRTRKESGTLAEDFLSRMQEKYS